MTRPGRARPTRGPQRRATDASRVCRAWIALCALAAPFACRGPVDAGAPGLGGAPLAPRSADESGVVAGGDAREPSYVAALTPLERQRILRMSPLPAPPPDPTNAVADDPAAARLGQALFFDARLSDDGSVACVTCHDPDLGWSDGRQLARGLADADFHAPTLWNVAQQRWFFWDGRADTLWTQALGPLENPKEHGADRLLVAHVLHDDARLAQAYTDVFGALPSLDDTARFPARGRPVPMEPGHAHQLAWDAMASSDRDDVNRVFANVGKALAAYERRITARRAPIDLFVEGLREHDPLRMEALDASAVRGAQLFVGRANCHVCHGGATFSDLEFHDVRLPLAGAASLGNPGRLGAFRSLRGNPFSGAGPYSDDPEAGDDKVSRLLPSEETYGAFKTPSLRNVSVTAPYMHRGHFASLDDVLDHYSTLARGGDPIGHHTAARKTESILVPLQLTAQEHADLRAFLEALTDTGLDPALTRPPEGLEPPPARARARTLDDFVALSSANLESHPLEELAGIDRVRGWRLRRDVMRALSEPDSARFKTPLFLAGVEALEPREAAELARFEGGRLFLRDLRELDVATAAELVRLRPGSELFLDGLTGLDADTARVLAAWPGDRLSLGALSGLSAELAEILAAFGGGLELDGLEQVSDEVARALSAWDAPAPGRMLSLDGVTELGPSAAAMLAKSEGWGLSLGGLASLAGDLAEALVASRATLLRLDGVIVIAPEAIDAMTRWQARFAELRGVSDVDADARARLDAAPCVFSFEPPPADG